MRGSTAGFEKGCRPAPESRGVQQAAPLLLGSERLPLILDSPLA